MRSGGLTEREQCVCAQAGTFHVHRQLGIGAVLGGIDSLELDARFLSIEVHQQGVPVFHLEQFGLLPAGLGQEGESDEQCEKQWFQWLVPSDRVSLLCTLYLPEGFFMGIRFTSSSVVAS